MLAAKMLCVLYLYVGFLQLFISVSSAQNRPLISKHETVRDAIYELQVKFNQFLLSLKMLFNNYSFFIHHVIITVLARYVIAVVPYYLFQCNTM